MPNRLMRAALSYAKRGLRVVPLHTPKDAGTDKVRCTCREKERCPSIGKHPRTRNGQTDATTDPATIERWWGMWPEANIGVVVADSEFAVLDVDVMKGGEESLADLVRDHGDEWLNTPHQITGSGGSHYLYRADPPVRNANALLPGIDVRGNRHGSGGLIVVQPSLHESGREYAWEGDIDLKRMLPWPVKVLPERGVYEPVTDPDAPILEGAREETMTRMLGAARRQGVGPEGLRAMIEAENHRCVPPLTPAEIDRLVKSASRWEPRNDVLARFASDPDYEQLDYPLTDEGNAEVLAHLFGQNLRYDTRIGGWRVWSGHRWSEPKVSLVRQMVVAAARARQKFAEGLPAATDDQRKAKDAVIRWAKASEMKSRQDAALELAQHQPVFVVDDEAWDADPHVLAVQNGVVNLRTGELREGRREDLITLGSDVPYDPNAPAPRWELFLDEVFREDQELIAFVRRAVGYSIVGDPVEQVLFLCTGGGGNGKSVMLNTLRGVLGTYAANIAFSTLERRERGTGGQASPDIAALPGKRLVTASETNEGAVMNEGRVKAITGADALNARFLYQRAEFSFKPQLKLWLAVNHLPRVLDNSDGFWRRIRRVPFMVKFEGGRMDKNLETTLKAEASGILAWMVAGAMDWYENGLLAPDSVHSATGEWREREDLVAAFTTDRCLFRDTAFVPAGQLYHSYKEWSEQQGYPRPMSVQAFSERIQASGGVTKARNKHGVIYRGIGIRADDGVGGVGGDPRSEIDPYDANTPTDDTGVVDRGGSRTVEVSRDFDPPTPPNLKSGVGSYTPGTRSGCLCNDRCATNAACRELDWSEGEDGLLHCPDHHDIS